jgi:hypothetical protein
MVRIAAILLATLTCPPAGGRAAGGDAWSLLCGGDEAVLVAPEATFSAELDRIKPPPGPFRAAPAAEPVQAELADLRAALAGRRPAEAVQGLADRWLAARTRLVAFQAALDEWSNSPAQVYDEAGNALPNARGERPEFPAADVPSGLPLEFAEYMAGSMAWHDPALGNKSQERAHWERILALPAQERRFKSTWAAYMLGRSWEEENPVKAIQFYQRVRGMAKAGYHDSLGLAAASLGREARLDLQAHQFERAIDLYLQQYAAGDPSARSSLCFVVRSVASHGMTCFPRLMRNAQARRVVTAYIISTLALRRAYASDADKDDNEPVAGSREAVVKEWLAAAEAARVQDPAMVEELALAAYQNGQWETARRWISRARSSPTAAWLQAKLYFRARRLDQGGALLTRVASLFPLEPPGTNQAAALKDNLTVEPSSRWGGWNSAAAHIRGELGVYHLARGEYSEALTGFLDAGAWIDAAYVAERVLTLEELKSYVDRTSPADAELANDLDEGDPAARRSSRMREQLRYLLARRLTRELRGDEAREYYPPEWQSRFDALAEALVAGWNDTVPAARRARALVDAAGITRTNGMELLGTELAPDWHVYDGNLEGEMPGSLRTNESCQLFPASADEQRRTGEHRPDPDVRFHYRYQAAALAWEAARLMPNDSDETARVLWLAGSWLKVRDPVTADVFYKALVNRNRKTILGMAADRARWFPQLDASGELRAEAPDTDPATAPQTQDETTSGPDAEAPLGWEYPVPGRAYVVHAGDTVAAIAAAASIWGGELTQEDILRANPALDAARLEIGQVVNIPVQEDQRSP